MRIFSHLSFVAFLLALALQFLVVRDANSGIVANMDALQQDRAAERAALGSGEESASRAPRKAFLGDFRNDMRAKVEKAADGKATVPQLALGALVAAIVLWALAILRKEDRPYYGINAVLLVLFCLSRWMNVL